MLDGSHALELDRDHGIRADSHFIVPSQSGLCEGARHRALLRLTDDLDHVLIPVGLPRTSQFDVLRCGGKIEHDIREVALDVVGEDTYVKAAFLSVVSCLQKPLSPVI